MAENVTKPVTRVLLNNPFIPSTYKISIEPDLVKFTFDGSVVIDGTVTSDTNRLVLHSKELLISSACASFGDKKINASTINFNIKETSVEFIFPESIPAGTCTFSATFVGMLNNQMAGFYRSSYTDIHGNKKIMGSTQFEPLDARRAFPCIDEPAVKVPRRGDLIVYFALKSHFVDNPSISPIRRYSQLPSSSPPRSRHFQICPNLNARSSPAARSASSSWTAPR